MAKDGGPMRFVTGDRGAEEVDEILGTFFTSSMITWDMFFIFLFLKMLLGVLECIDFKMSFK